jgi:hypothetical protein
MSLSAVYQRASGDYVLGFDVANDVAKAPERPKIIAIVDESGSMVGTPFRQCLEALYQLHSLCEKQFLDVIFFNHQAHWERMTLNDIVSYKQDSGRTNFNKAIDVLVRKLENDVSLEFKLVDVIMFTDGQGSYDDDMHTSIELQRVRFHVIALGYRADTHSLLALRNKGYERGYFGYAKTNDELIDKILEAASMINGSSQVLEYRGCKVSLQPKKDPNTGHCGLLSIQDLTTAEEKALPPQNAPFDMELLILHRKLAELSSAYPTIEELQQWTEELNKAVELYAKKMTRTQYGDVIKMRTFANDILDIIAKNSGRARFMKLDNTELSAINEAAQQAMPRRFVRSVYQREEKNAERISWQDTQIEKLKTQLVNLESQPDLRCHYTLRSCAEALQDGDCFCIGINGSGTDVAIMNPYRYEVLAVTPTLLTYGGFIDAAYYEIKKNPEIIRKFDKGMTDQLAKGIAREDISGVVPLYLNKDHWNIARHYMDRACAQLICKNPMASTLHHKFAAVLLALQWVEKKCWSEFYAKLQVMLKETLSALYRDHALQMITPKMFLDEVENRLPTKIQDLKSQMYLWRTVENEENVALTHTPVFLLAFWEERLRRSDCSGISFDVTVIQGVLNLPLEKLINPIGQDENGEPTFAGLDSQLIPNLTYLPAAMMEELKDLDPNVVSATVMQLLLVSTKTNTLDWPTLRLDLNNPEAAAGYVLLEVTKYIKAKQATVISEWQKNYRIRRRMERITRLCAIPEDQLSQELFDLEISVGAGDIMPFLLSASSPTMLRFVAKARFADTGPTLDKRDQPPVFHVSKKNLAKLTRQHKNFITKDLLLELWPEWRKTILWWCDDLMVLT